MPSIFGDFVSWLPVGLPAFLFIITVVVFFHELGHFLVARAFGVSVQSFSVGFGKELIGWTDSKGTRWKISLLPLGGYVKFAGDADAASRPDAEELKEMDPATRAGSLHFKPLYQRALVVAAGPIANFILAIVIYSVVFMMLGRPVAVPDPIIGTIVPGSAAAEAGIQSGDVIKSFNGQTVNTFAEFSSLVRSGEGKPVLLQMERKSEIYEITVSPRLSQLPPDDEGHIANAYLVGVGPTTLYEPVGPITSVGLASERTWWIVKTTMYTLGGIVSGHSSADQLSGPIGIAGVAGQVAEQGFVDLILLAGLLSVSIGLINLFPIPMLDGGHLLYYAFEAIRGRPLGERAQELGFRLGLAFVLCLMLFATFNDLVRYKIF